MSSFKVGVTSTILAVLDILQHSRDPSQLSMSVVPPEIYSHSQSPSSLSKSDYHHSRSPLFCVLLLKPIISRAADVQSYMYMCT